MKTANVKYAANIAWGTGCWLLGSVVGGSAVSLFAWPPPHIGMVAAIAGTFLTSVLLLLAILTLAEEDDVAEKPEEGR